MTWPTSVTFGTTHTDQGTDSPASARADLNLALQALAAIIGARGQADGVASLGSTGLVPAAQLTYNVAGAPPKLETISGSPRVPAAYLPRSLANGVASLDATGRVPVSELPAGAFGPATFVKFNTNGAGNWPVPSDVTRIKVYVTGAGGGGGARAGASGTHGGGGGAGATCIATLSVTPGANVAWVVGAGGAPAAAGDNDGTDGGDSTLVVNVTGLGTTTITAGGGGGGLRGSTGANAGASGVAACDKTFDALLLIKGGIGEGGYEDRGGMGGGSYWQGGNNNGASQAFGGGGANGGNETIGGERGAHGLIVIEY